MKMRYLILSLYHNTNGDVDYSIVHAQVNTILHLQYNMLSIIIHGGVEL
jgi:hypothetical protein